MKSSEIIRLDEKVAMLKVMRLNGKIVQFLIGAEDIPKVRVYRRYSQNGYCCTVRNGRQWYLSWKLFGRPEKGYVLYHINRNPRDNQKCNIRLVTIRENVLFRRLKPNKSTGRRGVSRYANGSFVALIGPGGRRKSFKRFEDAIRVRKRFERSYLMTGT